MVVPSLPVMNRIAKTKYPEHFDEVNNKTAGLFNSLLNFSQILGPILGTSLQATIGFRHTTEIIFLVDLVFLVAYLGIGGGLDALKSINKKKEDQDEQELETLM